jgi:uncharacterized YigZ family protein
MEKQRIILAQSRFIQEIKKSNFVVNLFPVESPEEALQILEETRTEFKDATHNVFAWRIGSGGEQQRYSDDGEPSGTAGKPVLNVLERGGYTNLLVVVTRYYGGIKLGAGGLIRAYAGVVSAALAECRPKYLEKYLYCSLVCSYAEQGHVKKLFEENEVFLKGTAYDEEVTFHFYILPFSLEKLSIQLRDLSSGKIEVNIIEETERPEF